MSSDQKRKTPSEKLEDLRKEFYGPRRINAQITTELHIPMFELRNGNRVMAVVEVRIHSLDFLPADERALIAIACDLAAQRMRAEMKAGR